MPLDEATITFMVEVVIEPDETGFHAYCPALKGLHTCGDTEEEALQNAAYAAEAYIRSLIKHGEPIPVGVIVPRNAPERSVVHTRIQTRSLKVACTI